MRIPLVALVLTAAAALPAMDEGRHSAFLGGYRFGAGVAPGLSNHEAKDSKSATGTPVPAQDVDTSLSAKQGSDFYGGMFINTALDGGVGVAVVPTIFYRDVRGNGSSAGITYRDELKSWGGRLAIGPAFAAGPLALEITPFIGVGSAWMETELSASGTSVRRHSGSGVLLDYGLSATAYYLFDSNCYLGVSAGYDAFRTTMDAKAEGTLAKQKITVKGNGIIASALFGFWF
jgi:hypothetical protein